MRHSVPFTIGSRRLLTFEREVETLAFTLEEILGGVLPRAPVLDAVDGLRVLSAPPAAEQMLHRELSDFKTGARETFGRNYIAMDCSFDEYLARFSGKTRSTLRRKQRRVEKAGGGELDMRAYRSSAEMDEFLGLALPLSDKTYQARLLDAGLPASKRARAEMHELAQQDRVRAFLLFLNGEAAAYLYLPVVGDTLVYAYLGYAPEHANLSPGTVLQMAALESLFAEGRFRYFDFTEGEGAHKALFGTDSVECASFLMLRPTLANRALLAGLDAFNTGISLGKKMVGRSKIFAALRRSLRT